nr:DNRLRE domain-containing protein [Chloroflexota bacterium]
MGQNRISPYFLARARHLALAVLTIAMLLSLLPNPTSQADPALSLPMSAAAEPITVVFQEGVYPDAFYMGVADTHISLYEPATNFGTASTMRIHPASGGRERGLIKFDISMIPTTATVLQATLYLYAWYWSYSFPLTIYAYRVKKHWNECEATWDHATTTDFWHTAGCSNPIFDYDPHSAVSTTVSNEQQYYSWDVTQMAQLWVTNPLANEGVLLVADGLHVQYQFRTSEIPDMRPYLVVTYLPTAPSPTPTCSATPTITPVYSPTPTITPVYSPTPTMTPVYSPTPTMTPVYSPTPTRTSTPAGPPTPTNTPTPTSKPTRVPTVTPVPTPMERIFQQEFSPFASYYGTTDTSLASYRPDTPWGNEDSLRINGREKGTERTLIRFDLEGYIPTNAHILSAKLSLFAWSRRTLYGMRVSAFAVLRPWDEAAAIWNSTGYEAWAIPGCEAIGSDREGTFLASTFVYFINKFYDWDVTPLVQRWVSDPWTNHGILLLGQNVDQEIRFRSSEWPVLQQRPKLTVIYSVP